MSQRKIRNEVANVRCRISRHNPDQFPSQTFPQHNSLASCYYVITYLQLFLNLSRTLVITLYTSRCHKPEERNLKNYRHGQMQHYMTQEGRYEKVRTPIFLTNYNYNDNKIYTYHGYTLYKAAIFSTKSSLQTQFFQNCVRRCMPVAYLFAEVQQRFTHATSQLVVVRKTASSECVFQGAKKMEVGGG